ncbi:hypothetical protein CONLIGDRAFT_686716 [Coniochaeta ligniaria NRRL 30616]|uniref:Uncharacterized protein n=1 Tax=Coniochaeta ligniaria NRRL 30616 TaxID=1408157 RepID=A0A1J7I778_9PEZI|nr:hypothetical protein CONLIGDRAFT_686716 [Coniochaeta ligniaria NRRL 30616]
MVSFTSLTCTRTIVEIKARACDSIHSNQPARLPEILAAISQSFTQKDHIATDNNFEQPSFLTFTLDPRDHHHITDGFPQLLDIGETLQRSTAIPYNFDPATGKIEIMVANEAYTQGIAHTIVLDVHMSLQGLKTTTNPATGAATSTDKRISAIQRYTLRLTGDDGSVWSPIIAYRDGNNAVVPHIVFMFVGGSTTGNVVQTKLAGDARVLMTRLGIRTVVAYNLPIPQNLEAIDMARFLKRASATVWVFDDEQAKPVAVKQEGLSTALWLSDFVDEAEGLAPEFVRPRGGNDPDKIPNVVIKESAILTALRETSDAIVATRSKGTALPGMRASVDINTRRSFSTLATRRDAAGGVESGHRLGGMPVRGVQAPARGGAGAVGRTLGGVFRRLLRK